MGIVKKVDASSSKTVFTMDDHTGILDVQFNDDEVRY